MDLMVFEIAAGVAAVGTAAFLLRKRLRGEGKSLPDQPAGVETLQDRLAQPRKGWVARLGEVLKSGKSIDAQLYQHLEEILITADVGVKTTQTLLNNVRQSVERKHLQDPMILRDQLKQEMLQILRAKTSSNGHGDQPVLDFTAHKPLVLLIIGVNGVGKTTTIGKLAALFVGQGRKVMLAAGDTFRAAAVEQLQIWGERAGVEVICQKEGKDPSAVAFDAVSAACAREIDLLIIDTAGRLHTKVNLMEELKKVCRTVAKRLPGAPHEIWLILDATTGQNAVLQARTFNQELGGISGLILTKLDGTAKGGVLISLAEELGVPLRFIGVGEKQEDLRPFEAQAYIDALFAE